MIWRDDIPEPETGDLDLETLAIKHMAGHARLNEGRGFCDLDIDTDWPYECVAKDERPDDVVVVCRRHLVWSHFERPGVFA